MTQPRLIKITDELPHPGIDVIISSIGKIDVAHLNIEKDTWVQAFDSNKTYAVNSFDHWCPYHWYDKEVER